MLETERRKILNMTPILTVEEILPFQVKHQTSITLIENGRVTNSNIHRITGITIITFGQVVACVAIAVESHNCTIYEELSLHEANDEVNSVR